MIMEFATKRDINGNVYYLGFDTERKVFAEIKSGWGYEDCIRVTKKERRAIKERLRAEGYTVEHTL